MRTNSARGAVAFALLLVLLARPASAQVSASDAAIHVGASAIGGVVTSAKGPEAGVWVIAETNDLPTKYALSPTTLVANCCPIYLSRRFDRSGRTPGGANLPRDLLGTDAENPGREPVLGPDARPQYAGQHDEPAAMAECQFVVEEPPQD